MNVLLVSQCSKNALKETRRILDQFAERRGDRTWQTPITMQGLQTLHKMLRKTARKNTAVACHWIRGRDHSELMWIVGDAKRFNAQGATPTNTTKRDVLRNQDENDWHTAEDIRLLAAMAALFHDLGKANDAFQKKLRSKSKKPVADAYRHEWVSLRLFEAFVGQDSDEVWLGRMVELSPGGDQAWLERLKRDGVGSDTSGPFKKNGLPPLAQLIGWLIVSHHRTPTPPGDCDHDLGALPKAIKANWCGMRDDADAALCWQFNKGLPSDSKHWCEHVRKLAKRLLQRPQLMTSSWFDNPYVVHLSRMALMLADHYYSAEPSHSRYGDRKFPLSANTDRETGKLKQRLDEHLIGVEVNAARIVRSLPRMAAQLPRIARHKGFRQRSKDSRFRWQDKAYDLAVSLQTKSADQGFFGVNMASTGCGKTLGNGRIMYGLADANQGARFNIALGLRTLTLQTGDAYRDKLNLGDEDMAVLVGGGAIRTLHKKNREPDGPLSYTGSESAEDLLLDNTHVHFEGSLEDGPLNEWLKHNRDAQKLLNAPILACTIDHLIPATDGTRGGRQIAPMLRLMSSDLILDEPDDFGVEDLPALTRLVYWAGMLGSRVLLSSATLPPALIQGLFNAYRQGRRIFQDNRGEGAQVAPICCGWFDEFGCQSADCEANFVDAHQQFVDKRIQRLSKIAQKEQRRKAEVKPLPIALKQKPEAIYPEFAGYLYDFIHTLHDKHAVDDPKSDKRISLGLVRMANIKPLVEVARALYALGGKEGCYVHLCVYHSQHPLLMRSAIEKRLDRVLKRHDPTALFEDEELRAQINSHPAHDHIFVVLATAVAEVGRDHDYDWAIVEPSSQRSITQLAGRVRRHRDEPKMINEANLYLLDTNIKYLKNGGDKPAFCRPGFESDQFMLASHRLTELLTQEQLAVIDASSRIQERRLLEPAQNLVDIEHAVLHDLMLEGDSVQKQKPVYWWWTTRAHLCGYLQRKQQFRNDPLGRQRYALLYDDNEAIRLYKITPGQLPQDSDNLLHPVELNQGSGIGFWGEPDYEEALTELAERFGIDECECAKQFGFVDLEWEAGYGWNYHPALGFWKA
ncbi:type I-F CRISPR-associated helicase Cas3 [Candidatus Tenderia electrophaga]|jgi:CRISPR-associated endonuclease/helicase Cas3|uniref:Type I-F CRISPR-associated helicase Cas3 n=1 Tax=Candidatus Tenderia electrophaga TaxID=1748243 RepID=A0A0S2TFA6_9GAMM|nr:type I-F CRISPR-associated helicase Cas3 [Candidatus Tenderia electrophaga]